MISQVAIEGLRGFAEQQIVRFAQPNGDFGSGLTLIIGPNNSGKSTIVEALKLKSSSRASPSFHSGMRNPHTDFVDIKFTNSDGSKEFVRSIRPGSSECETSISTESGAVYTVPSRRYFNPNFGKTGAAGRNDFSRTFSSHSALRENNLSYFESRIFHLEQNHSKFTELLRRVVPEITDWSLDQIENSSYFVKIKMGPKTHSISGSGDGILSVFVIVAALFDSEKGDVLAIDEPELSLHPAIQKRLAEIIYDYASDRQIIISTHSPYFIEKSAILNGAEIIRTWDRGGRVEIFQINSTSCVSLKALLSDNVNNPHMFGLDAKEIFFSSDSVLIFEGQDDVVLWPRVVGRRPIISNASAYGWGAGGAGNIKNVVSVLKGLGYRRIVGILDNNRPKDLAKLNHSFPEYMFFALPADDIRSKEATPGRDAVIGLMDEKWKIREEYVEAMNYILTSMELFLTKEMQDNGG